MTNHIEHFTAPGKYYIDKFFEKINKIVSTPREKTENKIENHNLLDLKLK